VKVMLFKRFIIQTPQCDSINETLRMFSYCFFGSLNQKHLIWLVLPDTWLPIYIMLKNPLDSYYSILLHAY